MTEQVYVCCWRNILIISTVYETMALIIIPFLFKCNYFAASYAGNFVKRCPGNARNIVEFQNQMSVVAVTERMRCFSAVCGNRIIWTRLLPEYCGRFVMYLSSVVCLRLTTLELYWIAIIEEIFMLGCILT